MSQIKLNLDDVVKPLLDHEWPQDCLCLAGRYADFPITENSPAWCRMMYFASALKPH